MRSWKCFITLNYRLLLLHLKLKLNVAIKGTNGVISDDSDCLLFGAEAVYKGFFGSGAVSKKSKKKKKKSSSGVTKITMSKIEDITGLSRNDLIVLAHLLGCDYCTGVEGIGPKRALELVRQVKASDPLESLQKIVNLSENNESKYQKWLKGKISNNFIDARITQAFQSNCYSIECGRSEVG